MFRLGRVGSCGAVVCAPASSPSLPLVLLLDLFATRVRTRKRSSIVRHDVSTTTSPPYTYFNDDAQGHAVENADLAAACGRRLTEGQPARLTPCFAGTVVS